MVMSGYVHWEEGLLLQPHHLQMMQRQALERYAAERRHFHPHPSGVIEAEVSPDELRNMQVRFERLQAIMPSGRFVDVPALAELPPLDISSAFRSGSGPIPVLLGVPLWYASRGNTIDESLEDDWRARKLYRVADVQATDENTGDNPQPVRVRRINARLLLDGDDATDYEVLPVLRIVRGAGADVAIPREDPEFAPTCLVLQGSPRLFALVRELVNAIDASRRELAVQMTRGGFSIEAMRGVQFEQLLRHQALGRACARLPQLLEAAAVTPLAVYLELRTLLAELAALNPAAAVAVPDYDHERPWPCFAELSARIRTLLRVVAMSFIKVDFRHEQGMFVAELADEHFQRPTDYFLAIRTRADAVALARLVEDADRFKLMPRSLAGRAVYGVKLVEERHPPLQLPADNDLHYFRLIPADNARVWERIQQERVLTAQWPGSDAAADASLTLYMPVATGEARP
jgi:type VI secretion system ImpJ/VasE family protein